MVFIVYNNRYIPQHGILKNYKENYCNSKR